MNCVVARASMVCWRSAKVSALPTPLSSSAADCFDVKVFAGSLPCGRGRLRGNLLQVRFAAQLLDLAAFSLAVDAFLFRRLARCRRLARLALDHYRTDQLGETLLRIVTVLFLGAKPLRLDHQHTVLADARIVQRQQPFLVHTRQ